MHQEGDLQAQLGAQEQKPVMTTQCWKGGGTRREGGRFPLDAQSCEAEPMSRPGWEAE
jgi:hypothetical protein